MYICVLNKRKKPIIYESVVKILSILLQIKFLSV